MQYLSTRDDKVKVRSSAAIKKGISDEGGLFVPEEIPYLTLSDIKKLENKSYIEKAVFILKKYLSDFLLKELEECAKSAYSKEKFGLDNPAPLKKLSENMYILELWHGPTCAFKDMALQIFPYILSKAVKKTGEKNNIVILAATSGDTGKAALAGFKDVDKTSIAVFYPTFGVSDIQKLQMITQEGKNVDVVGINGSFDDAQSTVKKIFTDEKIKDIIVQRGYVFSSANSINWGRLSPQIVYYFSAYCDLLASGEISLGEEINVCVPTGNFGNILAAYYAKKMGLPIKKLICASNSNNVLTNFLKTGVYDRNREFYATCSPSMDILISSNVERLLYDLSGQNVKKVSKWMRELDKKGEYFVGAEMKKKLNKIFWSAYCDDYFTKECIYKTNKEFGYTVDTHTAVAIDVYKQYLNETGDETKTVIVSTASPFKFSETVLSALGKYDEKENMNSLELINLLSNVTGESIPEGLKNLSYDKIRFDKVINKEDMESELLDFLK